MSEQKRIRRISILQNVSNTAYQNTSNPESIQEADVYNKSSSESFNDRDCRGKENRFDGDYSVINSNNKSRRRFTASMHLFEEEPVFSDSDEEREYHGKILETQGLEMTSNETPKKISVAVQCNLDSNEMTLKSLITECAKFDIENVNEDFKEVVLYCKQLQQKYEFNTTPVSMRRKLNLNKDRVTEMPSEMKSFCQQPETMTTVQYSQSPSTSKEFLPSRSNNDYTSERVSVDDNIFKVTYNKEALDQSNNVNIDESTNQSTRLQKSIKLTKIGKNRYRIVNGNQRNASKRKRKHQDVPPTVSKASNNTNVKRPNTASHDSYRELRVKRDKHEVHSNLNKRPKRSNVKTQKLSPLEVAEKLEGVRVKIQLPHKQVRSLARNWMKPRKSILKKPGLPVPLTNYDFRSSPQTHRVRRLYSPTEWLLSEEFNNLLEPE